MEGSEGTTQNLVKGAGREAFLAALDFEAVFPPGIKPIKQVEMWKKWRKYVPPQLQHDPLYTHPGEDTIKEINADRNQKAKARRKRKDPPQPLTQPDTSDGPYGV